MRRWIGHSARSAARCWARANVVAHRATSPMEAVSSARSQIVPVSPPGNEHAIRVALTVVRNPHRWPAGAVAGNRLYLPLFAAGDMPTKTER